MWDIICKLNLKISKTCSTTGVTVLKFCENLKKYQIVKYATMCTVWNARQMIIIVNVYFARIFDLILIFFFCYSFLSLAPIHSFQFLHLLFVITASISLVVGCWCDVETLCLLSKKFLERFCNVIITSKMIEFHLLKWDITSSSNCSKKWF